MDIGYSRYEKDIMSDPHLDEERKRAWKQFEAMRQVLLGAYAKMVKESDYRISNAPLSSAIRDITCSASNRSMEANKAQWREAIERYCQGEKDAPVKEALLQKLEEFEEHPQDTPLT